MLFPAGQLAIAGVVALGLALSGPSTSAHPPQVIGPPQATSSGGIGQRAATVPRTSASIADLRRVSGLTWEQLARLFGVSRRSVHFWASGKPMKPGHEEHLRRLVAVIWRIDRGSALRNRQVLFNASEGGESLPFDLLSAGRYEQAEAIMGPGCEAPRMSPSAHSRFAPDDRAPRPPAELVDTLPDDVHVRSKEGRPARSVRYRGGR